MLGLKLFNIKFVIMFDYKGFRRAFNLTQAQLADILMCGQPNISAMEKTMKNLEVEHEKILIKKYGEDSIRKFTVSQILDNKAGEGEMLKDGNESTGKPRINYTQGVPYYNVDFMGGFEIVENERTINPEYLIDFKPYAKATCWCNISGHSMEPEINSGDIIALRRIDDFSFLPMGEIYAIVTKNDMRTVKRIGPSANPDNYTLIPTNKSPEYGIQELPKNMIRAVFEVMGCMKRF